MWEIFFKNKKDDFSIYEAQWKKKMMLCFNIPEKIDKMMSIIYRDGRNNGKLTMVECKVHKTFTEHIPMWTYHTKYLEDGRIKFRIYNEIAVNFTATLNRDGSFIVECPTKMKKVPLDKNGHPIRNNVRFKVISGETKINNDPFVPLPEALELADIKIRRNSA